MTETEKGVSTPLSELIELLGEDVYFVPCELGTKKPILTYVERPFEGTKTEAYLAVFDAQPVNVAVYLGKASGGLCAIDFDRDEDLEEFLQLNPKLENTTRSRGSRGAILWVRIEGWYPESCNPEHKHFEWRADGRLATIHGIHPKGMSYQLVVHQAPVRMPFREIVWPGKWELPWVESVSREALAELEEKYGKPFYEKKDGEGITGLNERFWAALFAKENKVLFEGEERTFYLYDEREGLWYSTSPEAIRESISARIFEVSRETRRTALEMLITHSRLNPIVSMLKGIVERRGVFRTGGNYVHVANGVIRFGLRGETLFTSFSPQDYSRNRSPIAWDPEAECPRFLNELLYPAVSPEDADLLQRWAGLAITGFNSPQRILILDGTPNGGKGTLARILQALVGVENTCQLRTECLLDRFETFRFRNRTLLIGPDVRGGFLMEKGASTLKMLVGGDPLTAEGKGLNGNFSMFGTFNILITCNSRLRVRLEDDTGAWRRRLLIVRYEKPPPKSRILNFHEILLREEGSGILRWALTGLAKLRKEFRQVGDFILTPAQAGRVDALLQESESLKHFVNERVEANAYADVTTAELSQAYAEFCADRGWNALPVTIMERQLPDLMLEFHRVSKSNCVEREGKRSNRGFKGARLKDAATLRLH